MTDSSIIPFNEKVKSLYIPIIGSFVNEDDVKKSFINRNIAEIERVDFIFNNIKGRREAFVYISCWNENKYSVKMVNALLKKNNYRFFYLENNKKLFWPLLINKNPLSIDSPNRVSNNHYTIEERINKMSEHLNALESISRDQDDSHEEMLSEENKSNKRQKLNDDDNEFENIPALPMVTRQNAGTT